jgi:hypothetical protein
MQKSQELWLKEGDRNTKFFHASTQLKIVCSNIFSIKELSIGDFLSLEEEIIQEAVKFLDLLSSPQIKFDQIKKDKEEIPSVIPKLVMQEDKNNLLKIFTIEKVKNVFFSSPPKKTLGHDGLTIIFFQKCWDFMC